MDSDQGTQSNRLRMEGVHERGHDTQLVNLLHRELSPEKLPSDDGKYSRVIQRQRAEWKMNSQGY
jgi:hypothetical protein